MLRPSYNQLINKANEGCSEGEPVVRSRYSIVLAAAKRARQLVDGNKTYVDGDVRKPLSLAVAELNEGKVRILPEGVTCEDLMEEQAEDVAEAAEIVEEEETAEAVEAEEAVEAVETEEAAEAVETVEAEEVAETVEEEAEEAIAATSEEIQL